MPFGAREGYLWRASPDALRQFRPCPLYLSSAHVLVPVASARRAATTSPAYRRQNVSLLRIQEESLRIVFNACRHRMPFLFLSNVL